jgi:O-antigen ligase
VFAQSGQAGFALKRQPIRGKHRSISTLPGYGMRSAVLLFALVAALAMTAVAPEGGNILYLGAAGIGLLLLRPADIVIVRQPIVWMPLLGIAMLAVAYPIGAGSFSGLIGLAFVAPFLAVVPLVAMARSDGAVHLPFVPTLSLAGSAGAAAMAANEYLTTGVYRVGETVANPIHFADVALALGFLSLFGLISNKGLWRYLFLLGPIFAGVAIALSGTRGAVVAEVAMAAVAIILAVSLGLVQRRTMILGALAGVAVIAIALFAGLAQTSAIQRVLIDLGSLANFSLPTDASTSERLNMYEGGLRAFLAAPIFGHGPFSFVAVADGLATVPFGGPPHLHNDLADFAASAGTLGLVAYALLLLAPVAEAMAAPASSRKRGVIVIATTLAAGYFVMGLTNAMFGILTVTVVYTAICVVVAMATQAEA